ncbi:MAG: HlyD family type I secretion periplasmic adaptor subunit [Betaproteobacteria bacterium HGW-Betaproteobacteria-8]|nr:MAG: HlyD family type I secretion periplasmic adaptor subunit [Betaproteobacteria bacterium HGW-Betaproteobacteria-8]
MNERLFRVVSDVNAFFHRNAWIAKPVHLLLNRWAPKKTEENPTWNQQIEIAMLEQSPLRARKLLYWMAGILIILITWANFTKIDEVTRGEGRVIPSGQVQVVQSLDGGIVVKILATEGQIVNKGDPLILIDETRAISSLRENRAQHLALLGKESRLKALAAGTAFEPPEELITEFPEIYNQELALYHASKDELASQLDIARQQLRQKERELQEVRASYSQADRGYTLTMKELEVTKPLLASGAVSDVDILRLERDASRLLGDREQARAQIGRVQSAIEEARRKVSEVEQVQLSKVRTELNETTGKINALTASSQGLSDKVNQATLRAPVNGKISRLYVNTVGGVIQPGQEVIEVVPSDDALVLETKIQPKDIAFVTHLQKATVKLTAYDYTIYGTLDALVESISPDSIIDDEGNAYYIVKVRTLESRLGEGLPIIPGMVAQVDIITGKKSVLSYLLKPVLKAKSYAFTER